MRSYLSAVGLFAVLILLGGCERTFERPDVMPPGFGGGDGLCLALSEDFVWREQTEVDVWVGSADAIVIGTVVEASPVTDYYVTDVPDVESPLLSADQCNEIDLDDFTAFRVVLEDLEVLAGDVPERIEIRFGVAAIDAISAFRPTIESNRVVWPDFGAAIEPGMRIGGAVYEVNLLENTFYSFETAAYQPFFTVGDDGGIWFQEVSVHACVGLIPPVDVFHGKSQSMMVRKVAAAARNVSRETRTENPLRKGLGLDDVVYSESIVMLSRWLGSCDPEGWEPTIWTTECDEERECPNGGECDEDGFCR